MADNTTLPGTGTVVATDDVGGVQYQRVKLDIGADGATSPVTAANALPVALDAASLAALETVSVANFPATQPVSGTVEVSGSVAVTGTLTDAQLRATPVPVSGTVTITDGSGPVTVDGTVAVTGTFWQATQPVALDAASLAALETITVTGVATEATLAAASAKLPASLGIKTAANSLSVAPASDAVFVVTPSAAALTSISGTITTGGVAQNAAAANAARKGFWIQNNSAGDLWGSTLAAAVVSQPSLKLPAGAYYESPIGGAGTGAISIIGATAGQAFSGREW